MLQVCEDANTPSEDSNQPVHYVNNDSLNNSTEDAQYVNNTLKEGNTPNHYVNVNSEASAISVYQDSAAQPPKPIGMYTESISRLYWRFNGNSVVDDL
jgi:hypothetical protein